MKTNTGGQSVESQKTGGQSVESRKTGGQWVESQKTGGQSVESRKTDGQWVESQKTDGQSMESRKTDTCDMTIEVSPLPKNPVVGMAYVPFQQFGALYSAEKGFSAGTVFPDLDKPFLGKRGVSK